MTENKNIKYKLETLASYWPEDLNYPQFEVAYEIESGEESFRTVCCIDLAEQALKRITELEANQAKRDLEQQAKGIEDAVNKLERPDVPLAPSLILNEDLLEIASQLRKQAQELGK
jgi:hypothetical protein